MVKQKVFIIDDDKDIREMLKTLIKSIGIDVEDYESGESFIESYEEQPGCLILDMRMKGMSGLRLQEILLNRGIDISIIFVTGHGDIPMATKAMKNKAIDFLTKPFNNQQLLDTVQKALEESAIRYTEKLIRDEVTYQIGNLTRREMKIMYKIIDGKLNKDIAKEFSLSLGTIEASRSKIMKKMQVKTLAELIRKVLNYSPVFDD